MTLSPRLDDERVAATVGSSDAPAPHTLAEITRVLELAGSRRVRSVTIGHGEDPHSTAAARAFAAAWTERGGAVLSTVGWPEQAASWMREARALVRFQPDLYILAGAPAGLAQMIRRLVWSTNWTPTATIGFASAAAPAIHQLAGLQHLDGLTGATSDGARWRITGGQLITDTLEDKSK
jgi:hypothetical protein